MRFALRLTLLAVIVFFSGLAGCASYFSDELLAIDPVVRLPGDKGFQVSNAVGESVRFVQFRLGYVTARNFGQPPDLNRVTEFARVQLSQRGYCGKGFFILDNKITYTGSYGVQFRVECKQ